MVTRSHFTSPDSAIRFTRNITTKVKILSIFLGLWRGLQIANGQADTLEKCEKMNEKTPKKGKNSYTYGRRLPITTTTDINQGFVRFMPQKWQCHRLSLYEHWKKSLKLVRQNPISEKWSNNTRQQNYFNKAFLWIVRPGEGLAPYKRLTFIVAIPRTELTENGWTKTYMVSSETSNERHTHGAKKRSWAIRIEITSELANTAHQPTIYWPQSCSESALLSFFSLSKYLLYSELPLQ